MTALIVDDEPLARQYLHRLLREQGVEVLDEAEDVVSALEKAEALRPDLVFLDIQMPGLTGMQMAAALVQLDVPPLVVFVTGFSEHAAAAFEQDAVDYLVKPVAPERLSRTLTRARARLAARNRGEATASPDGEGAPAAVGSAAVENSSEAQTPLRRLPIREDYAVRLLRLEEIVWAEARDKRIFIHTLTGGEYKTYYTLTQLEQMLPADRFLRIHDSYIVYLEAIEELIFLGNHAYEIRVAEGKRLPVGRTRYGILRRRLGIPVPASEAAEG